MSMFNLDGQLVAGQLSNMYAGDVFIEILRGRRENTTAISASDLQQQLIGVHQQYSEVIDQYNRLADRFNGLLADSKRMETAYAEVIAKKDRQIAQLISEKADLAAEREESRLSACEGWNKHHDALVEIEQLKIKAGELPSDEGKPDIVP